MSYTDGLDKPNEYFNTVLYTGTGATQSISGVNFKPDFVWIKRRNGAAGHMLQDVVRGSTERLRSDNTDAEITTATAVTSFDSDGFSLGAEGGVNTNTATYASWNFLAGGTASSNTDGSITSSVSANTTSGFSIVSYTGTGSNATVGHGLGVAPSVIITKNRSTTSNWLVYHHKNTSAPQTDYLSLNLTSATADLNTPWNDTAPTSSVFSVGTASGSNGSGNDMIAYCFAEKKGFSKFGSYTGNGSTDGTFVYTGFKPAFIIAKVSDGTGSWLMHDTTRDIDNPVIEDLYPNLSNAETGNTRYDILSNGFKLRNTFTNSNNSGSTYIYMCFASNPFVTSTGVPATAR